MRPRSFLILPHSFQNTQTAPAYDRQHLQVVVIKMNDSYTLPELSPPPTIPADIEALSNRLELALGVPRSQVSSTISGPITPLPSLINTQSTPDLEHPKSVGSSPIATKNRPESEPSTPWSPKVTLRKYGSLRRKDRSNSNPPKYLRAATALPVTTPQPVPPDDDPAEPIYWVLSAGLTRARWSDLSAEALERGRPYLNSNVPHLGHDEQKRSDLRVKVEINRVIHGTHYGRPSVYVGLTASHINRRVTQTDIRVDVSTGGLGDLTFWEYMTNPPIHQPSIVKFGPIQHYGDATSVETSQDVGLEAKVGGPVAMVNTGVGATINRSRTSTKNERHAISAFTTSEPRQSNRTIFKLQALENVITKAGVYKQLAMGLIIDTKDRPVVLTFDVEPKQPVFDSTFRHVVSSYFWTVPVYIDHQNWNEDGLPEGWTREMDKWDESIWKVLVNYNMENETVSSTLTERWAELIQQVLFGE